MAEILMPAGGGRGFMPTRSNTNLEDSVPLAEGARHSKAQSPAEERLFWELHEMRRQIQTSCAEEIKSYSKRILEEMKHIKHELQSVAENARPIHPFFGLETLSPEEMASHPRTLKSHRVDASTFVGKAVSMKVPMGKGKLLGLPDPDKAAEVRAPSPRTEADPTCPLMAYGDVPPMLPFQAEGPPEPPEVEAPPLPCQVETQPPQQLTEADALPKVQKLPAVVIKKSQVAEDDAKKNPRRLVSVSDEVEEIDFDDSGDEESDGYSEDHCDRERKAELLAMGSRRLSLSVDACRRTRKLKDSRPIWKLTAAEFLNSTKFDNLVGALILLNAITIGVQTDYAAKNVTEDFPLEFQVIERIFLACFFLELVLRIYVHKCRFFCERKNIIWNYFDTCIVLTQVFEEALMLVASNVTLNTGMFTILRILRILRIVRILRVVRVLHLISELRTIVSSIIGSLKSLAWTVVLLLLVIYIVGVYFTQAITDYLVERKADSAWVLAGQDADLRYFFGSLSRTILSLWQSMSGGADWDAMAGPLIERVGTITGMLFAGFIAFALLALMNVVTGVFVQTALQSAKDEEDAFLVDQVLKLFDKAGGNETETITMKQVDETLTDPRVAQEWKSINVQPTEAKYLFSLLDIEDTGEISFQEFLSGCLRLHGSSKSMDVLTVMQEARSNSRHWHRTVKRWDEYHQTTRATLEGVANAVTTTSSLLAHLTLNIDAAVEVANQNQDKIGRLEKRIRSFESSLCSVRSAATSMSKVNELFDTLVSPAMPPTLGRGVSNSQNADLSAGNSLPELGHLCTIDEV